MSIDLQIRKLELAILGSKNLEAKKIYFMALASLIKKKQQGR